MFFMRDKLKKLLLSLLTRVSRRILSKYNPKVIGITGSYGKTSAREAIFAVLNRELEETVRMTRGELNGEWGFHIAVIGSDNPKGSVLRWAGVLFKGIDLLVFSKPYPDVLLIEMAADRPGDIEYMVGIVKPDIVVMTGIGATHLEFFGSVENVAKEKFKLITGMKDGGTVLYNSDDKFLSEFISTVNVSRKIGFGISKNADIRAEQIRFELLDLPDEKSTATSQSHIGGVGFKVSINDREIQAYVSNVVGKSHVSAALSAIAIAVEFGIPMEIAVQNLKSFKVAPGRMRLISGVKNTIIIDDSYNSSPDAAILALETLVGLSVSGVTWAVMGEMMELGDASETSHIGVGKRVAELEIDHLITVGSPAHFIAHGARESGMSPDRIFEFDNKESAGRFLQSRIKQGDLILVKASRGLRQETPGTRFEKIVKEIMADPKQADSILVATH